MRIDSQATDTAVLTEIGRRLARLRLEKNLTQVHLAEQAGVSKSTVQRLESGDVSPQLSGLIRVCRVLNLVARFELLVPEPAPSPIEQLKLNGKRRQRASKPRVPRAAPGKWQWGKDK
jgi:transcriptional regulator with XRE-family HTH domain